ncbi:MAG: CopD family protein [Pseudohongiella sp.]|uniref:copper resistance D family protein n=1 Tax=Pseudohongiella sp. TaxID=1979412 RepID=UPI00349FEE10
MSAGIWDIAILVSKWLSYMAMLAIPGAVFVAWLCRQVPTGGPELGKGLISHYLLPATVLGILASSLFFLFQVGAVNQRGLGGMFDPVISQILAQTTLGDGLRWRLSGFFLALIAAGLWYIARSWPSAATATKKVPWILSAQVLTILAAGALLCMAVSFAVLGHVSELGIVSRLMLVLHISAVCLWIGALIPLHVVCRSGARDKSEMDRHAVHMLMVLFGQAAWIVLGVLLVSGLYLAWRLSGGLSGLLTSSYGQWLLLKLLLVVALLGLSARHRFFLVPELVLSGARYLRRSIGFQIALAASVLLITAALTTLAGPPG